MNSNESRLFCLCVGEFCRFEMNYIFYFNIEWIIIDQ